MDVTWLLVVLLIGLILWKLCSKPNKFPPGPFRWPLMGNLLAVRERGLLETCAELARRHGEVVGLFLGSQPLVVISGLEAFKEASNSHPLSGRPLSNIDPHDFNRGILFNHGDEWREQRRFTLRHLRDLGFGKRSMEGIIHEEIETLLDEVTRMAGSDWSKPVELYEVLGTSGVNVLWRVLAGQRYAHADPRLRRLLALVKRSTTESTAAGTISSYFPWLGRLFPGTTNVTFFRDLRREIRDFIKEDVQEHRQSLDPENSRDFIDIYLNEMNKQEKNPDSTFTEIMLLDICRNLFAAGSDTTFNTITYALVYMVRFPHVQRAVQDELDRVVGRDRLPSLQDREKLVYTDAAVQETLRMSSVVPLAVPHAPLYQTTDVPFRGHIIPKDARVLLNLSYIHMDPHIWGDPENFRPERFIGESGKLLRPEALIPFGLGKRQCLGEALARSNVFLFFAAIMQRFSLQVPPGEAPPSLEPVGGFTLAPQPFKAQIQPRFLAA